MKKCVVYGLFSSRDNELRYIGQTTLSIKQRFSQHKSYSKKKKTAVHKWFSREVNEGYDIEMRVLIDDAIMHESEKSMIASHKLAGARLLNHTDGGEGTLGWKGNLGRKRPDLSKRNKENRGKPGHPMSIENETKLRAANKVRDTAYLVERNKTNHPWVGKKHTEETKEKIRAAGKKRVHSPETMIAMWRGRDLYLKRLRDEKSFI